MTKITKEQINFINQLRGQIGYKNKFLGNIDEMDKDKASIMISKLIWTRNDKMKVT